MVNIDALRLFRGGMLSETLLCALGERDSGMVLEAVLHMLDGIWD